ncbi:MAG: hypothetical protein ABI818_01615 [Acidobacteriota bacterium]
MTGCPRARLFVSLLLASAAVASAWSPRLRAAAPSQRAGRPMTLADARPVLAALGDSVPIGLRDWSGPNADARWSAWLNQRQADIRRRLGRGDEDSVVNLMLYGTRFTRWPRATPAAIAASASNPRLEEVMEGRVADLVTAIESPGGDDRLRLVRDVVERHGIAVGVGSRDGTRRYLIELRSRVLSENERYMRRLAAVPVAELSEQRAAQATLYRDRGLSSDTSLRVDFALDRTLAALRDRGELARHPAEHVAVVGPGLDFVDKAQGYDVYPVQMIQPFALADSLRRLGTAARPAVTTLDISPRVVAHLREARQRAAAGQTYRVHVLLERDTPGWRLDSALLEYWRRFGSHVGHPAARETPAADTGLVRSRAVDLSPETVLDVTGAELNIVLERLSGTDPSSRFGLVVATNVLVYYDTFEQALAVCNMASMLRDGGLLMTNQPVPVPATCGLAPILIMSVALDRVQSDAGPHERGDSIFVYRKA